MITCSSIGISSIPFSLEEMMEAMRTLSPESKRSDPMHMGAHDLKKDKGRAIGADLDALEQALPQARSPAGKQRNDDKLKIVLVEDESLFRRGLSELLTHCYDLDVLGTVGSIEDLRGLISMQPDLLIMDIRMKPMDGLTMLEQIRKEGCTIPAVMLTMSDSEVDLHNAMRAGVRGYLLKDMAPDEVVESIRRVAAGELVVAPTMTMKMIEILHGDQTKNLFDLLTQREREIMELLSRGESNKSIALSLNISYETVKQHVRHILNKLNMSSRVKAAVLFAKEQQKHGDKS
jgi:two-component system nitrate/nitrite response regulator NarL